MMDVPVANHESAGRGKILVADDDELFRAGLVQWLERHQYECTSVAHAGAARAALQASNFEAMIADIHMPGNAGLELIEQVPQVAAGLPVFLLTGNPTVETAARSVRLAVTAYLVKPPDFADLNRLLQEAITNYRRARLIQQSRAGLREWDAQLEMLAGRLRHTATRADEPALADYLRLTLRQVILQLAELESSAETWQRLGHAETDLQKLDLIGALRRTVEVLEQTKRNFKCKQLADLRRQLEDVLGKS